jgi:hypothetical protein
MQQDQWMEERRHADAATASAPKAVLEDAAKASSGLQADQARVARNLLAAESDVDQASVRVRKLESEGAPTAALQEARDAQSRAYGTLVSIRVLSEGTPFDDEEVAELRGLQKGIEASRELAIGLQASGRFRPPLSPPPIAANAPLRTPKLAALTQKNYDLAVDMERAARAQVQALEARAGTSNPAPAEEFRQERLRLMGTVNMLTFARGQLTREPENVADAARMKARQLELAGGSGLPPNLRELHRLSVARRKSTTG